MAGGLGCCAAGGGGGGGRDGGAGSGGTARDDFLIYCFLVHSDQTRSETILASTEWLLESSAPMHRIVCEPPVTVKHRAPSLANSQEWCSLRESVTARSLHVARE